MSTAKASLFSELYKLSRDLYRIYNTGDELRAKCQDHELLRYLRSPGDLVLGHEFLQRFTGSVGTDPPLSVIRLACERYHAALRQTEQALPYPE